VKAVKLPLRRLPTLDTEYEIPTDVDTLQNFIYLEEVELVNFISNYGLAMDLDDIKFCQAYFKNTEKRDPTITEIRMIDTYWSDHCRHTTFSTIIDNAKIDADYIRKTYNDILSPQGAGQDK
jgi:phosphoribosylformylglycinamidine synthase